MPPFATWTSLSIAVVLAAGCATGGRMEVLESRLRSQEDSINQLQSQLSESQSQLQAARREAVDLKTQLAASKTKTPAAEQFSALGQCEGISLNKFLTGGLDRDGVPGDELLSAVIAPVDADGNLVKVPGSVALTVLDLSKPENEQRVGHWEFSAKDSEPLWHTGFLGSGYIVRVPWQSKPQSPSLLVHARLKTVDGRQFDTSQSIHITPPTGDFNSPPPIAKAESRAAMVPAAPSVDDSWDAPPATGAQKVGAHEAAKP